MTDDIPGLGATGAFPEGKLRDSDQGQLRMALVTHRDQRKLELRFGKPVAWVAMTPEEALALARVLTARALSLM